jgi:hypothetical protein
VGVRCGDNNPTLYKENCREASKKFSRITEEDYGGGQGLSWAVEPRRERERDHNGVPAWRLGEGLTFPRRKKITCYEILRRAL